MKVILDKQRMVKTFTDLVKIDSLSFKEKKFAQYLVKKLKTLGLTVYVDNSAKKSGSDTGNIIAKLKGDTKRKPLLMSAHMDTVPPGIGIKPKIKGNRITSDGKTILAADCKAGMAIIFEILTILKEKKLTHPPLEIVFTTAEEMGVIGAGFLDYSKIKSKNAIIIDWLGTTEAVTQAPAQYSLDITIKGIAAHGGMCPENGLSALEVAAKAIASLKFGRIDSETTSNLGIVKGGDAKNTVMPCINLKGDARSHNIKKLNKYLAYVKKGFEKACKQSAKKIDGKKVTPKLDFKAKLLFREFCVPKTAPVLQTLKKSAKKFGVNLKTVKTNGCLESNHYAAHGINAPCIGCGAKNIHTVKEELDLKQFYKAADIVFDTVLNFK